MKTKRTKRFKKTIEKNLKTIADKTLAKITMTYLKSRSKPPESSSASHYITVWCALSFGTNSFAHIYYQMLCRFSLSTLSPVAYFIIINNFIFNHSLAFHFMFYLKFLFCYMNHSKILEMKQYLNLKTKIISKSRNLNF